MYKEAKKYKGFEILWHQLQMEAKAYVYTFLLCLLLHLVLTFLLLLLFRGGTLSNAMQVLSVQPSLLLQVCFIIAKKSFIFFLITTPVWAIFPKLLKRYQKKAMEVMQDMHLRGVKLASEEEVQKQIEQDMRTRGGKNRIKLGNIPVPPWAETRHFFLVGRSGTGKTTLLCNVIEQLIKERAKVVIHDLKGDYLSHFFVPERDVVFNPLDIRCVHWNLFNEIKNDADIDSVAASLIPHSNRDDKFWVDGARDVFASILHLLVRSGETSNESLYRHCSMPENDIIAVLSQAAVQIDVLRRAIGYLQGKESGSKVASDVLSTMRQYTNCFYYMRHLGSNFSIKEWIINDQPGIIFLTNYINIQDTLRPILSLFVDISMKHLLSSDESPGRKIFFILDEFANLQKLPTIVKCLELGRSKGASVWIASQDISQVQKVYGNEVCNTIVNNCNTICCFALGDTISCDYISKLFGDREIVETDESYSMGPADLRDGVSITRRRKTDRVILPSEFSKLRDLNFYIKVLNYDITQTRIAYTHRDVKNQSLIFNDRFILLN